MDKNSYDNIITDMADSILSDKMQEITPRKMPIGLDNRIMSRIGKYNKRMKIRHITLNLLAITVYAAAFAGIIMMLFRITGLNSEKIAVHIKTFFATIGAAFDNPIVLMITLTGAIVTLYLILNEIISSRLSIKKLKTQAPVRQI